MLAGIGAYMLHTPKKVFLVIGAALKDFVLKYLTLGSINVFEKRNSWKGKGSDATMFAKMSMLTPARNVTIVALKDGAQSKKTNMNVVQYQVLELNQLKNGCR